MTSVITEVFLVILQLYLFGRGVRIHYHTLKNCLKKTKQNKEYKSIKMIYLTHIIVILLFSFIYLPNKLPTE